MLILSFFTYTKSAKDLNKQLEYSLGQSFDQTLLSLENTIARYDNLSLSISLLDNFPEITSKANTPYPPNKQWVDKANLEGAMYSLIGRTKISNVKVYFKDDFPFFTNGVTYFNVSQVETEVWYEKLIYNFTKDREYALFCPASYLPENKNLEVEQLSVARIIINPSNYNDYIGILRIDFSESYLLGILNKNNTYHGSLTFIQNSDGEVVSTTDEALMNTYQISNLSGLIVENEWSKILISGDSYLVNMKPIGNLRYNLISIVPYEELLAPIYRIRSHVLVLLFVLITLAFVFALLMSSSMTARILSVVKKMNQVKHGVLDVITVEPTKDEIGQLVESYNYMILEMEKFTKSQFEIGKEIKNAELNALQAQINPHFLYNTLDMINWFSSNNMNEEIRIAVIALAKFYKLSLSKGREEISIKDELTHISMYMQIQNLRYRDQIHIEINVDKDLMDYYVIKTIFQPIVENAILHGIMERAEKKGHIVISGEIAGPDLVFYISDDGVGMTAEQISRIFTPDTGGQSTDYHGYGVGNVHKRINYLYGQNYGLKYSSQLGKGTTVEIKIPQTKLNRPYSTKNP